MYANPRLDPHEKLFLYRKRVKLSQASLVEDLNSRRTTEQVTLQRLKDWEAGTRTFDPAAWLPYQPFRLSASEWCIIQRRRAKRTQEQVAASLGIELSLVKRMEHGTTSTDLLVQFWEKRERRTKQRNVRANP